MRTILNTLLVIWQLPQYIIAGIFILYKKAIYQFQVATGKDLWVFQGMPDCSLSLAIPLIRFTQLADPNVINHEYGHTVQSKIFGPLYLIVVGLPSLIGNILHRFIAFDYYKQPWEWWADKFGKVTRA